ncbi:hypothetical protein HanLR1_Chr16g0623831 [Helianthus annuus]|nr:hypothetical protein HanLR1_Chr16g0623831 [Helianthus annuus]
MESFDDLDGSLIKYMCQICSIRAVGPLIKNPLLDTSLNISGDLIKADDCLDWLDSKQPSLVVYISFGSVVSLSQDHVNELAYGVLNSGLSFLWVIRIGATSTEVSGELPKGLWRRWGRRGWWSSGARKHKC